MGKWDGGFHLFNVKDISITGPLGLEIVRAYHSNSQSKGMAGHKWMLYYEMRVVRHDDNRLEVYDSGNETPVRFKTEIDKGEIHDSLQLIAQRAIERKLVAQKDPAALVKAFKRNNALLLSTVKSLNDVKALPERALPLNRFVSYDYGFEELFQTTSGYERRLLSGEVNIFDKKGRLEAIERLNSSYHIKLTYDQSGHLIHILDNAKNTIDISYNSRGLIQAAIGRHPSGMTNESHYEYDAQDRLIRTTSGSECGQEYVYQTGSAFLIKTTDATGKTHNITYDGSISQREVLSYTKLSGYTAIYNFARSKGSAGSRVIVKESGSENIKTDYHFVSDPQGLEKLMRVIKTQKGKSTTKEMYRGSYKLVTRETSAYGDTTYEYDDRGRVLRTVSPTNSIRYEYLGNTNKRTLIETTTKSGEVEWKKFVLINEGFLTHYSDSAGHTIAIDLDASYNLRHIVDTKPKYDKTTEVTDLRIEYSKFEKPTLITLEGLGSISVDYNEQGEINTYAGSGLFVEQTFASVLQFLLNVSELYEGRK